jgi:hypothetical protein
MEKKNLTVNNSIVRIVGVFEQNVSKNKFKAKLSASGFKTIEENDHSSFHKNYWYPEFRDMFFLQKNETSSKIYTKYPGVKIDFFVRNNKTTGINETLRVEIGKIELFTFKDGLNLFAIEVSITQKELSYYSDLTLVIRDFYRKVIDNGKEYNWVNWIEEFCLCGVKISSNPEEKNVKVDDYSGSKFKLYTILDIQEELDGKTREELLYDIGCVAPIGSAGGDFDLTPSKEYYKELMKNKISVFSNYEILPLFDSYTAIGKNILEADQSSFKRKTWSESYFRIYLYNLFIKFNLYRYNSELMDDSEEIRDKFEEFINTYNLSHLSYHFLPNKIFHQHRESLEIDSELKKFQQRVNKINQSIQEKLQKRTNLLIAVFTIITSLSSITPIWSSLQGLKNNLHWSNLLFYGAISIILLIVGVPVFSYLFPEKTKKIIRQWKNRKN